MPETIKTTWRDLFAISVSGRHAGSTGPYHSVTCDVMRMGCSGGRAEWSAQYDPDTLTLVIANVDGVHTPGAPRTHILEVGGDIRVTVAGEVMFEGSVNNLREVLDPEGGSAIEIQGSGELAGADAFVDSTTEVGHGDSLKERLERITAMASIPAASYDFTTTDIAHADQRHLEGNALGLLRKTARDWGAMFWVTRSGLLKADYLTEPAGNPRWMIDAKPNPAAGAVCASALAIDWSMRNVVNHISLMTHTSNQWTQWSDAASIAKYHQQRSYTEQDMTVPALITGTVVPDDEKLGAKMLKHGKQPRPKIRVVVVPIVDAPSVDILRHFRISDSVEVDYLHRSGWGFTTAGMGFISGFTFTADGIHATLVLKTGHPLDLVPDAGSSTGGSGGSGGTGAVGPQGAKGDKGDKGPKGDPGVDGATWYTGAGHPSTLPPTVGPFKPGDLYLQTGGANKGHLYTYTAGVGWHEDGHDLTGPEGPIGPQGPHGPPGHRGSTWQHTATMPPAASLEPAGGWLEGDQILHEGDGELFIYKNGAWADEGVSILGPQGPRGSAGHQGAKGDAGPQGHTGAAGPAGHVGPQGPAGQGLEFLTAVDTIAHLPALGGVGGLVGDVHLVIADGNLYTPNQAQTKWENIGHVRGPAGPAGPAGHQGAKGDPGATGHKGADGAPGHDGTPGAQGPRGVHGTPGATGPQGIQGIQGPRGPKGATGSVSDAHGDHRYLRLDASNDPLTGALEIHNAVGEHGPDVGGTVAPSLHLSDTRKHPQSGGALTFGAFNGGAQSAFAGFKAHIEDAAHHGRGWLGVYMRKASADSGMTLAHRFQSDGLQLPQHGVRIDHYSDAPASGSDKYGIQARNIVMSDQAPHSQHGIQDGDVWIQYSWT